MHLSEKTHSNVGQLNSITWHHVSTTTFIPITVISYIFTVGAAHGNLLVKVLEESSTKEQLNNVWE